MAGEDSALSLIQVALGGCSLYSLLTDGLKIALVLLFAIYLIGFIASVIRNRSTAD